MSYSLSDDAPLVVDVLLLLLLLLRVLLFAAEDVTLLLPLKAEESLFLGCPMLELNLLGLLLLLLMLSMLEAKSLPLLAPQGESAPAIFD